MPTETRPPVGVPSSLHDLPATHAGERLDGGEHSVAVALCDPERSQWLQKLDAAALCAELARARLRHGLSLNDAARALGMAAATLSRYENGSRTPGSAAQDRLRAWLASVPVQAVRAYRVR